MAGFHIFGDEEGDTPATPGFRVLGTVPEPTMGEVIAGIPARTRQGVVEAGGGLVRGLGDLLRSDTLSDIGADVASAARSEREKLTPPGMTEAQSVVSSAGESALQMLPAIPFAAAGSALAIPAGIGAAMAQTGGQRYNELRDAGFSGGRAGFHASIDSILEGLGEAVSLPVLASTTRPFLNKLWHFMARDLFGEEFTQVGQDINAMLSDKPDITWQEMLQNIKTVAMVTPLAAGLQVGAVGALQAGGRGARALARGGRPAEVAATPPAPTAEGAPTPQDTPGGQTYYPSDANLDQLSGLNIRVPVFVEESGEMSEVMRPAADVYNEAQSNVVRHKQLIGCLNGGGQ